MLTPYESRLILAWLANAASRIRVRKRAEDLAEWVNEHIEALETNLAEHGYEIDAAGIAKFAVQCEYNLPRSWLMPPCEISAGKILLPQQDLSFSRAAPTEDYGKKKRKKKKKAQAWRHLRIALRRASEATQAIKRDATALRLKRLAGITCLDDTDLQVMELLLRYQAQPMIESLLVDVYEIRLYRISCEDLNNPVFAELLGISSNTLLSRCAPSAPLVRSGLLGVEGDGDISVVSRLQRLCSASDEETDPLPLLLGDPAQAELEWQDFDHLGQQRADVEGIVRGALSERTKGVNVLLYGPPGTGKTEFARTLAARLGVALFSVGETDEDGDEPLRGERLADLKLGQSLLGREANGMLLFDEMDDLLVGGSSSPFGLFGFIESKQASSRLFMNRLLEENPAPTLWTVNDTRCIDRAILRRMMFAIEMRQPPPPVRQRIWARQLERSGIEAGPEDARSLAYEFDATPGMAAGAVAAAALLRDGDLGAVRRGVQSLSRLLDCEKPNQGIPHGFNPAFMQSDEDLEALADRLCATGKQRFSLCLQGPPGTGKSAWIRYLADRLGMEVTQKRASDLISMWVGATEKNIAQAFREAADDGSFLVFDEADSLLADRIGAQHGWEISQVNEMLTWMERHPLPFACTTNLIEKLDPATLRRFVFKISVGYLDASRAKAMFRAWFNLPPPAALSLLQVLTPGDFAVARQKAEILDQLDDPSALCMLLKAECDAKPNQPRPIGFMH
ncbi:MAG: AAA family ATPase [Gammaproteobacteria bacterium]|nr:AAA family ATPase [Gammaproteobacteria bacterium]